MKLNKIVLTMALALGVSGAVQAVDQGHGSITFTGSIVEAPCSIAQESIDQTVKMGQVSDANLRAGGKSTPTNFNINLENCTLSTAKTVKTTFTGSANKDGLLTITGTAKGANIAITDNNGEIIKLGTASTGQALQDGKGTLKFAAYLQGNSDGDVTAGDFSAVTDFTLAYQ